MMKSPHFGGDGEDIFEDDEDEQRRFCWESLKDQSQSRLYYQGPNHLPIQANGFNFSDFSSPPRGQSDCDEEGGRGGKGKRRNSSGSAIGRLHDKAHVIKQRRERRAVERDLSLHNYMQRNQFSLNPKSKAIMDNKPYHGENQDVHNRLTRQLSQV